MRRAVKTAPPEKKKRKLAGGKFKINSLILRLPTCLKKTNGNRSIFRFKLK